MGKLKRILLEGYRHQISPELYNIQVKNAKQELRLMIADIICNSFLTRDTKFKGEMGEYINNVHDNPDKTWTFTVFENSVSNQVNNYLVEKRLGEAVFYLCQSENTSFVNEKMKVISSYVSVASQLEVKLQTDIIASLLSYYIAVSSNFTSCINLLDNLLTFWIPELEKFYGDRNKQLSDNVKRDYLFYKDTVYTHTGDIEKSYECEELCDKLIDNMSLNWDNIAYRMKYENRKLITKMNAFDFEKAANECSSLINKCRGIKEALELVQDSENDGHFEELAKALGTRTQLYMFQIRSDINNYNLAVADSNEAIAEFEGDIDKKRQYSYRVQIETEKGNYDEALKYIFMQNGLSIEEKQLKDVIEKLDKDIFALYSYVRLMSEGSLNNWNKSEDMYEALIKRNYINELIEKDEKFHPRGLILWKFATYLMHHNMIKSAFDKYDTAVSYLFDTEDITTNFIGIAVLLERYAYALKNKKAAKENLKSYLRDLKKNYDNLYKRNMPESMKNIFTDIDFEKDDWNYYFQLSRRITY